MVSPENIHTTSIKEAEQIVFMNTINMYLEIHTYTHTIIHAHACTPMKKSHEYFLLLLSFPHPPKQGFSM